MRITEQMTLNTVLQSESGAAQRMARLSGQAASGLRVQSPSDDPAAYASLVQQDAQIGVVTARQTAAGGRDVFADLQALSTALANNDTAGIQTAIGSLGSSYNQVLSARVDAGERAGRLQSAGDAMSSALTQMQVSRAGVADIDAPT